MRRRHKWCNHFHFYGQFPGSAAAEGSPTRERLREDVITGALQVRRPEEIRRHRCRIALGCWVEYARGHPEFTSGSQKNFPFRREESWHDKQPLHANKVGRWCKQSRARTHFRSDLTWNRFCCVVLMSHVFASVQVWASPKVVEKGKTKQTFLCERGYRGEFGQSWSYCWELHKRDTGQDKPGSGRLCVNGPAYVTDNDGLGVASLDK